MNIAFQYVGKCDAETTSIACTSVLLIVLVGWFALENTWLDSYVRYTLTQYPGWFSFPCVYKISKNVISFCPIQWWYLLQVESWVNTPIQNVQMDLSPRAFKFWHGSSSELLRFNLLPDWHSSLTVIARNLYSKLFQSHQLPHKTKPAPILNVACKNVIFVLPFGQTRIPQKVNSNVFITVKKYLNYILKEIDSSFSHWTYIHRIYVSTVLNHYGIPKVVIF